jgi:Phage Tail Collar Domain
MGEVRRPVRDVGREVSEFRHGRRWTPRKNPCERPPGQPDFAGQPGPMDFEVRFRVREAKTHLEFYGYAVWNEQTVDSNGLPFDGDIDRYHFQWKVTTDAAGNTYAHENGEKVRGHKTVHVADDNKSQTLEVTGSSGGTFKISVGSEETGTINWNATAAQVKTALAALNAFVPADITEGGGPLNSNPVTLAFSGDDKTPKLVISDDDLTGNNPSVTTSAKDAYRVDFGRMQQPRRLYVSCRLRVRAGAGCWSDWSLWTTPVHPIDGTSDPVPPVPANTSLTFDHQHSARFDPLRAIVAGDYVGNWDVPGGDKEDDMARYHIQLQYSNDNGSTWEWPPKKNVVRDKDDNDNRWRSVFHNIDRRKVYRYRVCSEDRFNRRGPWGPGSAFADGRLDGWSAQVDPKTADANPPAPTFLQSDIDRARLTLEIAEPDSTWKPRIDYYEWEVYYDTVTAPNLVQKDRMARGLHKRFTLRKPKGHTVITRVRAYTASDEVSAWAQITCTTWTPPLPTIGSVAFDVQGTRLNRYRAIVPVSVNDAGHNDNVDKILVRLCHKPTNVTPTTADKKQNESVRIGDDPQEGLFRNIPKRHYVFVRAKSVDGDDKESAFTGWVAMGRPVDSPATSTPGAVTGLSVATPAPRRVTAKWDEPDDDEVTRWRVVVKRAGTTVDTALVRNNRHVYRVPKADVGINHTMEVAAINDLAVEGALTSPGSGTPDDEDISGAGWDVGDIKKKGTAPIPAKWLRCNGNAYSTSSYPELFAVIGYTYGGSGATFNVPDLNGRHPIGESSVYALGANDGDAETVRSAVHQHTNDSTATPLTDDNTDGFPAGDFTGGIPDPGDAGNTAGSDFTQETTDHRHDGGGLNAPAGGPNQGNVSAGGSQNVAQGSHTHNINGLVGVKTLGHDHQGHGHNSGHGHNHGHGSHHHNGHNHGGHGHGHKHGGGGHGHGHGHDNKKRPHLAVKFIIKAMS